MKQIFKRDMNLRLKQRRVKELCLLENYQYCNSALTKQ